MRADVVARPCAERLTRHLEASRLLRPREGGEAFVERFLEIRERNRRTADQTGREITAAASLAEALDDAGVVPTSAALDEAIRVYFSYEESRIVRLKGAKPTLTFLKRRGIRLALLSNATDGAYIARVAARLELREFFDPFVVSADIGLRKPRAESFRAVLDTWNFSNDAVAMVGDSLFHDVDGANRLGLYSIHLTQIPNTIDAPHRGTIVPRAEVASHEALRETLAPLLDPES